MSTTDKKYSKCVSVVIITFALIGSNLPNQDSDVDSCCSTQKASLPQLFIHLTCTYIMSKYSHQRPHVTVFTSFCGPPAGLPLLSAGNPLRETAKTGKTVCIAHHTPLILNDCTLRTLTLGPQCLAQWLSPSCLCWSLFGVVHPHQQGVPLCMNLALQVPPERVRLQSEQDLEELMYLSLWVSEKLIFFSWKWRWIHPEGI